MTSSAWRPARLGFVATTIAGGTPASNDPRYWSDGVNDEGTPWVSIGDITQGALVSETSRRVTGEGIRAARLRVGRPGTLLFAMYASVGELATLGVAAAWNQAILGIEARPGHSIGFVRYALLAQRSQLDALTRSNTQNNLNRHQVERLPITVPPLTMQTAIADFLDRECERIALLTARLTQLRSAMTETMEAVFRALVEGAPRVPLRRMTLGVTDGPFGSSLASEHYVDAPGVRVIRLGDIGEAQMRNASRAFVDGAYAKNVLSEHRVRAGDLVMAGLGDANHALGRSAVVPRDLDGAVHKADCYRIRVNPVRAEPGYLAWALSYGPAREHALLLARGSTRSRLNTVVARDLPVPALPQQRQADLVREMTLRRQAISRTSTVAQRTVASLADYRHALITEAVTGQFDVTKLSDSQLDESAHAAAEGERPEVLTS